MVVVTRAAIHATHADAVGVMDADGVTIADADVDGETIVDADADTDLTSGSDGMAVAVVVVTDVVAVDGRLIPYILSSFFILNIILLDKHSKKIPYPLVFSHALSVNFLFLHILLYFITF